MDSKCSNIPMSCTTNAHFYIPSVKLVLFLFSHLLTCKTYTISYHAPLLALILHLTFLKYFAFYKFNMPSQKYDTNNNIRIIFIKILIKINIIKIYIKNTHFITRKYNITRIFIKVEYIFICLQSSKKFFNHFTCNKPMGNKFQCC